MNLKNKYIKIMITKFYDFILEEFKVGDIPISNMQKYLEDMSKGL